MIRIPEINLHLGDCMDLMREKPNGYYSLAVIDPPYGLGDRLSDGGGKLKNTPMAALYREKTWDALPDQKYWSEIFRVSKNQVVFGANYFLEYLPSSRGFVCWDKKQDMPTLSACELIWTSFDCPAKIYRQSSQDLNRFHPTQKPQAMYKWLLSKFAKPGDRILDTHGGSGSSMIACYDLGFDMDWIELDPDYFKSAKERFERHKAQGQLFHIAETLPEQQKLF